MTIFATTIKQATVQMRYAVIAGWMFLVPSSYLLVAQVVDVTPPEELQVEYNKTGIFTGEPAITFTARDFDSGIDHYEVKLIPLYRVLDERDAAIRYFQKVESPYILPKDIETGTYDVLVRAYDKSSNVNQAVVRINIASGKMQSLFLQSKILESSYYGWVAILAFTFLLFDIVLVTYLRVRKTYRGTVEHFTSGLLPEPVERKKLLLETLSQKHGFHFMLFLCISVIAQLFPTQLFAATLPRMLPPSITTYPRELTSSQFGYFGGSAERGTAQVLLSIDGPVTEQAQQVTVIPDQLGDWFYQLPERLSAGNYQITAVGLLLNESSPPSVPVSIAVTREAFPLASLAIRYGYLIEYLSTLLLGCSVLLLLLILYYRRKTRSTFLHWGESVAREQKELEHSLVKLKLELESQVAQLRAGKDGGKLDPSHVGKESVLREDISQIEFLLSFKDIHES